jgi:ABC-type transporter Mla subunit MlaD
VQPKTYDERIYRKGHPPHRIRNALILIALAIVGIYLAWTKSIPFQSHYELHAVFQNGVNVRADSPVRIAGVNVGKVESVKSICPDGEAGTCPDPSAAEVTFTVNSEGQPIRSDALVEIRPRIFLEGNFFLDVQPGSPSARELHSGDTIPISQTSTAVQLDQILTSLQAPDRANLQKLLAGYGNALQHKPTAADDATQDPEVQGLTAAQAINKSFTYGPSAARDTAIVNEALLGTEPHDLSALIAGLSRTTGALSGHESELQGLITNFNITTGALASEAGNLQRAIKLLGPTLAIAEPSLRHTNETLPFLRTFARDLTPAMKELPATIASSGPWLQQTAALLGPDELQPIAHELRLTAPPSAIATAAAPGLFQQTTLLSRCTSNVLVPTGNVDLTADSTFPTGVPNFKEFGYAVADFAGESQTFDANGPYLRFQSGGGSFGSNNGLVSTPQPGGGIGNDTLFARTFAQPIATQPVLGSPPPFRTDVPCYLNAIPDLNGPAASPGAPSPAAVP